MAKINLRPWREELRAEKQKQFVVMILGATIVAAGLAFLWKSDMDSRIAYQQSRNAYIETATKQAIFDDFDDVTDDILEVTPTPPHELSPERLSRAMDFADILEGWVTDLRKFVYEEANAGRPPMGYKVVKKYGHRKWKSTAKIKQLMEFKGIGEAKAISIAAALELGRRRRIEDALQLDKITSSRSVFDVMQPILGDLPHEEFWILYLNNSNKVIQKNQLSKGGITGTLVDVRLVLKNALEVGAVALILCHNHPSGTLKPSKADKAITQKLKVAAQSLDISVLDHLIITENAYYSFADENSL